MQNLLEKSNDKKRKSDHDSEDKSFSFEIVTVKFSELQAGNILARNIEDESGNILIPEGQEIFDDLIQVLLKYKHHQKIKEPIYILKENN